MASAATLKAMVAIPETSMLNNRLGLNAMRHRWQVSNRSIELDHVKRPVAPCDGPTVNVPAS